MKNFYRRERKAWFVARARHSCSQIPLSSPFAKGGKKGIFRVEKEKRVRIRLFAPLRESLWFHCGAGAACVGGE